VPPRQLDGGDTAPLQQDAEILEGGHEVAHRLHDIGLEIAAPDDPLLVCRSITITGHSVIVAILMTTGRLSLSTVGLAVMDLTVSGLAGMISTCWRAMAAFGRDIFAPALAM